MNPNDFASLLMLTAAVMLVIGVGSGFALGLFWRWFVGGHEGQQEVMRTKRERPAGERRPARER